MSTTSRVKLDAASPRVQHVCPQLCARILGKSQQRRKTAASSFAFANGPYQTVLTRDKALNQCETDGRSDEGLVAGHTLHLFQQRVQGPQLIEAVTAMCSADVATPMTTQKEAEAVAYATTKLEGRR